MSKPGAPASADETGSLTNSGPAAAPPEFPQGASIGRYIVLERLGMGGMGVVYTAYDPDLHRRLAIKLLHAGPGSDGDQARLLREAQALAQLSHPNVVSVYDVGTCGPRVFLAMELVEGKTVRKRLEEPFPWREVLRIFRAAGEGLAAAHRVGLVHRDFKPDNVLLGNDGRVFVMDFGLARTQEERIRETAVAGPAPDERDRTGRSLLDSTLTQAGQVLGTQSYMAPEQFRDLAADARSDQFAFFVSLYEALFGTRPFKPGIPATRWTLQPPAPNRTAPSWLRQVVLKGLSLDPAGRFESMDHVLRALAKDPSSRRRRLAAAAGVAVLVAGAAVAARQQASASPCELSARAMEEAWTKPRQAQLERAFLSTRSAISRELWARTRAGLDAYAGGWSQMRRGACEATRVRGEQSDEVLTLRSICLDRRLQDFSALVDELARADDAVALAAPKAVQQLPLLQGCADVEALRAPVPRPEAPDVRAEVEKLEAELSRIRALVVAGKADAALPRSQASIEAARALRYRPLEAEALELLGDVHELRGDYTESLTVYDRAAWAAIAGAHREVIPRVAAKAVNAAVRQSQHDVAERWLDRGKLALEPLRMNPAIAGLLERAAGQLALRRDRLEEAGEHYARALALFKKSHGERSLEVANTLQVAAMTLSFRWQIEPALAGLADAKRLIEELQGAEHPDALRVQHNIAGTLVFSGRFKEAEPLVRQLVATRRKVIGEGHPNTRAAQMMLLHILAFTGEVSEGLALHERELAEEKKAGRPPSLAALEALTAVAQLHAQAGRLELAIRLQKESLSSLEAQLGREHQGIIDVRSQLALLLLRAGRTQEAAREVKTLEEVMAALAQKSGATEAGKQIAPARIGPRLALLEARGELELRSRQWERARLTFEELLATMEGRVPANSAHRIFPTFGLARALAGTGQKDRAVALLEGAITLARDQDMSPHELAPAQLALSHLLVQSQPDRSQALAREASAHLTGAGELHAAESWLPR